jgi:hypothetical protein
VGQGGKRIGAGMSIRVLSRKGCALHVGGLSKCALIEALPSFSCELADIQLFLYSSSAIRLVLSLVLILWNNLMVLCCSHALV